jgi:galactokinase
MKRDSSLPQIAAHVRRAFQQRYGREPRWLVAAPGRVNLIGEHTDYNDGYVLPMAIERETVIAADRSNESRLGQAPAIQAYSESLDESCMIPLSGEMNAQLPHWASYVAGTLAGCRNAGLEVPALDLFTYSSVPLGGGLSSSASLEVATATLLEAVCGRELPVLDKIKLCQWAEHQYAGVPCGIMDQFAVTMAQADHLMLLDCRSLIVEMIELAEPAPKVLIVNSNVRHSLGNSQYAMRRQECQIAAQQLGVTSLRDVSAAQLSAAGGRLEATVLRRARHVISEIERTQQAAEALRKRAWHTAGELMYASHESLRDDYDVSCAELDLLVDLARKLGTQRGVFGSRMTGGGFGGCTVSLVDEHEANSVAETLATGYTRHTGIEATVFVTRPAAGARQLRQL